MITKRQVRVTLFIIIIISAVYILWLVKDGLYPFLLGFILAYLLNPAVVSIEAKGLRRLWAIIVLYGMLFFVLILGGCILVPIIVNDLEYLSQDLPQLADHFNNLIHDLHLFYQNTTLPYSLRLAIDNTLLAMEKNVQIFIEDIVAAIVDAISHFIGFAISPVLAFYLLFDWEMFKKKFLFLIPAQAHQEFCLFLQDVDKVLGGIIRGQVTIAVLVGTLATIGLALLQVKFALLIGILAGILDIIPYFGAIIGAAPAIALAILQSPMLAIKVTVLFLMIHQLEGTIIQPKIIGDSVGLHPLSVIFCVFIGGELSGVPGMLLGVPVAAVIKLTLHHLFKALL